MGAYMGKVDLKELFYGLQNQMISKLTTNRQMVLHPGAKGDATELNWIQWLKDYLPKRYCVDKAFIIDCENNISDQIDVVIYDQQYSPFVFNQDSVIYIPAESVYAVFEVKQELSKEYIEYAGKKAESVRSLRRTSAPIPHAGGFYPPKQHQNILSGILTLTSSWSEPLGECFEKSVCGLTLNQRLDIGCVLRHGSFCIDYKDELHIIERSTSSESFIFFFLKLLIALQRLATTPMIDIECYARALDSI
jgi:hypothetical protein